MYICHVLVTSLPVGVDDVLSGERENFDVDLLVVVVVVEVVVVSGPTVQIIQISAEFYRQNKKLCCRKEAARCFVSVSKLASLRQ